jgi:hypothetical protein
LDKNSRGDLLWKVYLQEETKEAGMGNYLYMVPFVSALNFLL